MYRNKEWGWVTLYKWDSITVEEHLDWKVYFSKNWKYLTFKILPEKRKWIYKLPMAPANSTHFKEMKNEIDKLKEVDNIKKENEQKNKKTYFEIHWKPHPFVR